MKNIKDIEKLGLEELREVAANSSIPVPEGLKSRMEQVIDAQTAIPSVHSRVLTGVLLAAAACMAMFFFLWHSQQKPLADTFNDPYLAYAEVQKTFTRISAKMSPASDKALEAKALIEKPNSIIRKINK